jgi:hypothetical protein
VHVCYRASARAPLQTNVHNFANTTIEADKGKHMQSGRAV